MWLCLGPSCMQQFPGTFETAGMCICSRLRSVIAHYCIARDADAVLLQSGARLLMPCICKGNCDWLPGLTNIELRQLFGMPSLLGSGTIRGRLVKVYCQHRCQRRSTLLHACVLSPLQVFHAVCKLVCSSSLRFHSTSFLCTLRCVCAINCADPLASCTAMPSFPHQQPGVLGCCTRFKCTVCSASSQCAQGTELEVDNVRTFPRVRQ